MPVEAACFTPTPQPNVIGRIGRVSFPYQVFADFNVVASQFDLCHQLTVAGILVFVIQTVKRVHARA